jgi:glycosyltransferase involved in cell wall biosynthesis
VIGASDSGKGDALRILQVLPTFSSDFGGPVRSANAVAQAYGRMGEVTTVGTGVPDETWRGTATQCFSAFGLSGRYRHVLRVSPKLVRFVAHNAAHFDAVHLHFSRGLLTVPVGLLLARRRLPYFVQTHGMCEPWLGWRKYFDSVVTRRVLLGAKGVLTLSDAESERLRERYPGVATRVLWNALPVSAAPSGEVTPQHPETDAEEARLLFCARLHPRKGLLHFVKVGAELQRRGVPVRLIIVGADEGAWQGAKLAMDQDGVPYEYVGGVSTGEVASIMRSADVLLHPAPREPFGMSMLEAMAVGLPVVAAESSLLAPLFKEAGAALLPDDTSVEEWAASVAGLLLDADARLCQIRAARQLVEKRFSLQSLEESLRSLSHDG